MSKPILVANWKNHPNSLFEAKNLLRDMARNSSVYKKLGLFIAPPLTYFESVSERSSSFSSLACQDIEIFDGQTVTGSVGPDILKSFKVELAIIGHSERRSRGETDEAINKKIKLALKSGMRPLLCVGELSKDTDGEHFEILRKQLTNALSGVNKISGASKILIAYEPVWAIGKSAKESVDQLDLKQTVIFIKKVLSDVLGRKLSDKIAVLYGGSVEPANASMLMRGTGVKGFLVGHASLSAKNFIAIAKSILES